MHFILLALALFLVAFGVQGLLFHLTRNRFRPLAFFPLLAPPLCLLIAWKRAHTPSMFFFHDLLALVWIITAGLILLGIVLGWAVFGRKR